MELRNRDRPLEIRRVLLITLVLNLLASASKIFYGYFIHSVAIVAEGFHSMFDGISNVAGLVGIRFSSYPPDEEHPYGHRKIESVLTIFVGAVMFVTCLEIFRKVYDSLVHKQEIAVSAVSFVLMAGTLVVNIFVALYEKRKGKKLNSEFLLADARHTQCDIYSTIGVIISLILVRLGITYADTIVGALVGVLVAKAGFDILKESAAILVDKRQLDTALINKIVCSIDGVTGCHKIRTRGTNSTIFLDLHVMVNPLLTVESAHRIAHVAEENIRGRIPEIIDIVVHIEPATDPPEADWICKGKDNVEF
ncbi:MAG: cation transporter [Nitrospirae bacterium]|nr:cation transporter [Nitrospirota bacterium]